MHMKGSEPEGGKKALWMLGLWCLLSVFWIDNTLAEETQESPAIQLDEIVSATRQPTVLEFTSAFGEVISQEEILDSTARSLDEILARSNGIQFRNYGPGGLSYISLRGASSEQVLVLIDGERLNNAQSGGADLSQILLDGVQQIEILRGGQSALYGADAMGGILYIVTGIPRSPRIALDSSVGSFGARQWHTDVSHRWRKLSGSLSYTNDKADNDFRFTDAYGQQRTRSNSGYVRQNVRARLEWRGPGYLRCVGEHYDGEIGVAGPLGQTSELAYQKDRTNALRTHWEQTVTDWFRYQLNAHVRRRSLHYRAPGPFDIDALHKLNSIGGEMQGTLSWNGKGGSRNPLIFGVSMRQDAVESSSVNDQERNAASLYLQQEWQSRGVYLFPAMRLDTYSDFDAGWSPKLGWRIPVSSGFTLKGNLGRSYRAPALNDLYWPEDGFAKGNPDLRPERSFDVDMGVHMNIQRASYRWTGNLVVFYSRFKDRILWSPAQEGRWMPANLNEAVNRGIEFEQRFEKGFVNLDISYTLLNAKDANDKQLVYAARHKLNGNIRIGNRNLWGKWSSNYQSKRFYTRSNTRWLDPFVTHDLQLGVGKQVGTRLSLKCIGEIRNLLDSEYQLVKNYPLPGRELRLKVSIQRGEQQ